MTPTLLTLDPEPVVVLENAFTQPFNNAVATARTCYSSRVIRATEMDKDEKERARRDAIAESIYEAGHHTTLQHATFQFVMERVSRQFIWSFLHAHPYYNSEQVSQRYVAVKPGNYTTPPIEDPKALEIYRATIAMQMEAYSRLMGLVDPAVRAEYFDIFKTRAKSQDKWKNVLQKKGQEIARYVLPVATHAHLYHTISGITLHRYHRLCRQFDTPLEQKIVVDKMVEEVNRFDPLFFRNIQDTIALEETVEFKQFANFHAREKKSNGFVEEFDAELGSLSSKLIDYKFHAQDVLAKSVRSVLGIAKDRLSDANAIDMVMNPAKNRYFSESLNLTTLSKLTRTLVHPHYTFQKKISHTADSQDQRHRMTPASRPILHAHFSPNRVDAIMPVVIEKTPAAREFFWDTMDRTWKGIRALLERGVPEEFALYLLPNAFPIRFEESGDLLSFHHKWTHRLCYTAQEEIWRNCWEEVQQVKEVHPLIAEHLGAPCSMRIKAEVKPYCPEGDRFCGVPVWGLTVDEYKRVI